ncbi:MAG: hypothetical protein RIB45_14610 [Marivibrio sp.]|uniref:hypothetical protein n=1 Tax=Marivibrio sp. TaxID=2039719 RepID=UPI0032EE0C27
MPQDPTALKAMMEDLIAKELARLARSADLVVFALYDPESPDEPQDYQLAERPADGSAIALDVAFDFEGVGVWYLCFRDGETFSARKVLLQMRAGRYVHGQVGWFEGYWDEFPQYVAQDGWVRSAVLKAPANAL